MKNLNTPILVFTFMFMALILSSRVTPSLGSDGDFDYSDSSDKGPAHWGGECNIGKSQSPINLFDEGRKVLPESQKVTQNYAPLVKSTLEYRGHDITLKFEAGKAGNIKINGTKYDLLQMHWHTPSEHTINGHKFALEQHMVHKSENGEYAVIAVLYRVQAFHHNVFLKLLEHSIKQIIDGQKEVKVGELEPGVFSGGLEYYRYMGSLTTPNCTEGVIWNIKKNIRTLSKRQLKLFKDAVHHNDNARPIQLLNDRDIFFYSPNNPHLELVTDDSTTSTSF